MLLRRLFLALTVVGGLTSLAAQAQTPSPTDRIYTLGVVPQFPVHELHQDWQPIVEHLSQALGITLQLKLAPSIPRFEQEFLGGQQDFVYLNPYHQVMALQAAGYQPLVRETKKLTGILVVRKDDPIQSVKELQGKELAFPSPNALGASLWMRALLTEREGLQFTATYVQTHSNVYRQVLRGRAQAGGGVNRTLMQEDATIRRDLRILYETPGVAPHPIAAHPRVPLALQQRFVEAFLRLAQEPQGQALLKAIAMPSPMRADYARDYRELESLRLERYVVLDKSP